jgi:hypothetical protein
MEMHAFIREKKASFYMLEAGNLPKNGDACICMGEKGFIFILEAVNLSKNGDACICMGEKGFILQAYHLQYIVQSGVSSGQ